MKRGRKAIDPYKKYISEYNKQKKTKANWDDPEMLSKAEFELVYDTYTLDSNLTDLQNRNAVISDIIQKQKWGYGNKEKKSRKIFYEENLKSSGYKWSDVKSMTHSEFEERFVKDDYYSLIADGATLAESKEFISSYMFGS